MPGVACTEPAPSDERACPTLNAQKCVELPAWPAIESTKNPQHENHVSRTPNRWLCDAVRSAPSGVGWASRWPCTLPVNGTGRPVNTVRDGPWTRSATWTLAAAAGPAATRMARAAMSAASVRRSLCNVSSFLERHRRQIAGGRSSGSDASPGLSRADRLTFPALSGQWPPHGDAGRTPLQRRDRAGFAPASLDRSRSASVPGDVESPVYGRSLAG